MRTACGHRLTQFVWLLRDMVGRHMFASCCGQWLTQFARDVVDTCLRIVAAVVHAVCAAVH
eukprot:12879985-Prorocentrum_lima.AAC.1